MNEIKKPGSRIFGFSIIAVVIFLLIIIIIFVLLYFFRVQQNDLSVNENNLMANVQQMEFIPQGKVNFIKEDKIVSGINVEIADTPERTSQGLMFRKNLNEDQGMLFIFDDYRQRRFHMKNTIIPLDIIFADSNLTIVKIHKNTIPFSETKLYSGKPVKYAVEVNAGYTAKNNITEGDRLDYKISE
jgi:uncharacterized protein